MCYANTIESKPSQVTRSGMRSSGQMNAQYLTFIEERAGTQRTQGTPNCVPRVTIFRLDPSVGETPNSSPHASVLPFHGGSDRKWFSSHLQSHGKSCRIHAYPKASLAVGDQLTKNARFSDGSSRWVVKPPDALSLGKTRKSVKPASILGHSSPSNSAPGF